MSAYLGFYLKIFRAFGQDLDKEEPSLRLGWASRRLRILRDPLSLVEVGESIQEGLWARVS
jgi:hypothetical protein